MYLLIIILYSAVLLSLDNCEEGGEGGAWLTQWPPESQLISSLPLSLCLSCPFLHKYKLRAAPSPLRAPPRLSPGCRIFLYRTSHFTPHSSYHCKSDCLWLWCCGTCSYYCDIAELIKNIFISCRYSWTSQAGLGRTADRKFNFNIPVVFILKLDRRYRSQWWPDIFPTSW